MQGLGGFVTAGILPGETPLGRIRREAARANVGKPMTTILEPRTGHARVYTSLRLESTDGAYVDIDLRGTSVSDVPEA